MNHIELADHWNAAHQAWAAGEPQPPELDRWRAGYSGTGAESVDDLAMPEPWLGDLTNTPEAITMGIHPGTPSAAFQHRGGVWPNVIADQHAGSYADWAATGPYFGSVWESAHGVNKHFSDRQRFLSAWTGIELAPSQVVDFPIFPWHATKWKGTAFSPDPEIISEFVLEPIASAGAKWAFGFGKDWWELIEALDLPILDKLGGDGRPYPTQVDHRRWLVAAGPKGLRLAAMRLDGMATPPKREEVEDLRRSIESGPAGANVSRSISPELEIDVSARLGELGMSQTNRYRLMQAIDDADVEVDGWHDDPSGDSIVLTISDEDAVVVRPESADFVASAPAGSTATPDTDGAHRLELPAVVTATTRVVRKEAPPLGMCRECFNVLNPDGTCPMECGE